MCACESVCSIWWLKWLRIKVRLWNCVVCIETHKAQRKMNRAVFPFSENRFWIWSTCCHIQIDTCMAFGSGNTLFLTIFNYLRLSTANPRNSFSLFFINSLPLIYFIFCWRDDSHLNIFDAFFSHCLLRLVMKHFADFSRWSYIQNDSPQYNSKKWRWILHTATEKNKQKCVIFSVNR